MKKGFKYFNPLKYKNNKNYAFENIIKNNTQPQGLQIYKKSAQIIYQSLLDIKMTSTYRKIAFIGACPHYLLQTLLNNTNKAKPQNIYVYDVSEKSLQYSQIKINQFVKNARLNYIPKIQYHVLDGENWQHQKETLNLIISSLNLHNVNNLHTFLTHQHDSLVPDGTILGNTLGRQTLQQLRISFILAENQRYGGISPHVSPFIQIDSLGNILSHCNFQLPTLITKKFEYFLQSPIDLIQIIKQIGQNSSLIGNRKGAYQDLFLSMLGIYQSKFSQQIQNKNYIIATCELIHFIGWKYSQTQKKAAKRGSQQVHMGQLLKELSQQGEIQYGQIIQQD